MRVLLLALLMVPLALAGCADDDDAGEDPTTTPGPSGTGGPATGSPDPGNGTLEPREAAGISGEFLAEVQGNVSSSINRCQSGRSEVALPTGYDTVVVVLRWEPAESQLRATLTTEGGRDPQPEVEPSAGEVRATWTGLSPGSYTLGVEPAGDVTAATQYDAYAAMVPTGYDPSTVDPTTLASVPGSC